MAGVTLGIAAPAAAQEAAVTIDNTSPIVGQTLTAQPTELPPKAGFQWLRCTSADPSSCAPIQGATALTYGVHAADAGGHLAVRAQQGDKVVQSPVTEVVREMPAITAPAISGEAIVGGTLMASAAATGVPTPSVSYEWQRCPPGDACASVGGNAPEYSVAEADAGAVLRVRTTATNSVGSVTSGWTSTSAVQVRPQVTSVTIAGQAVVGEKLTASADATGTPTPGLAYQWFRCAPLLPLACKPIDDASAKGYVVASADAGDRLAVVVTATNPAGSAERTSEPTSVVPQPVRFDQSTGNDGAGSDGAGSDGDGSFPGGSGSPSTDPTPSGAPRLRYLRPFPVVRVKGFLVPGGAQFSLVRVKAPRESRVTVQCRKPTCALPRRSLRVGRIRALERRFAARTKITIRVRKPGLIGKYVRIVIRDGRPPKRRDACLLPGDARPVPCPAA